MLPDASVLKRNACGFGDEAEGQSHRGCGARGPGASARLPDPGAPHVESYEVGGVGLRYQVLPWVGISLSTI